MNSTPFTNYPGPSTPTPNPRGRPPGGAKRGRKPRVVTDISSTAGPSTSASQPTPIQWTRPSTPAIIGKVESDQPQEAGQSEGQPIGSAASFLSLPGVASPVVSSGPATNAVTASNIAPRAVREEEEEPGEDDFLPAMADDDYSAQLSWQSQSKDNLKVLMDNFSPAQYERFEAYRRHALPKQAVRKVIQQTLGQQVSQPVAQIVAGFAKVFVGEIIEKARAVQERRGDVGPLSPDHLREAYRAYQEETGRVGAARPLSAKRLFVR